MRIAVLGATSQIAKDLILSFSVQSSHELVLFARRPDAVSQWLTSVSLEGRYSVADFTAFRVEEHFDAILNFVGVGDPVQAVAMGAGIFDITLKYDELALDYVRQHLSCRYIYLSSGAAYGGSFDAPANGNTKAVININHLQSQDWYGVAKLHAECRHRALAHLPIVDIRVYNYFSHTQDMEARFLITDIVRAIRTNTVLKTSAADMVRDYLHPSDFFRLVSAILASQATNAAVDCYSKAPIDKNTLLNILRAKYGLQYEIVQTAAGVNATGSKPKYYSLNKRADDFSYQPGLTSLEGIVKEMNIIFTIFPSNVSNEL
jgi:nucleoside-diphosphate-sugar epimerase